MSNTSKLEWWSSWFYDPADAARIEQGYHDAEQRQKTASKTGILDLLMPDFLMPQNRAVAPVQDTMNHSINVVP